MAGRVFNDVYEIAADRFGVVTTAQARAQGIRSQTLVMMAKRGALVQISRGVYRLAQFPQTELDHYMEALAWPSPARATLSHESALELFEISDVNSSRIHITVPERYRTRRQVPQYISLHRADLNDNQVIVYKGLDVTSPDRTILDCHEAALGPAIISQAIADAERKGLLRPYSARSLRELCL